MNIHRIHRVSKLTGLSKDVIRVWERRYGLIKPARGPNRYRLYTDEDVALLRYLQGEMETGESIGELAAIGRDELLRRMRATVPSPAIASPPLESLLRELVGALDPLDRIVFERRLNGAVAVIPFEEALHGILLPLQERVGELWHQGQLSIGIEHYVTRQVQQKIYSVMNQLPIAENGPKVVVACPQGETHEIGAQTVTYLCKARGCRAYYLGSDVPISSLGEFCNHVGAHLALLSVTIPLSPENSEILIRELMDLVTPVCQVLAGGIGAMKMKEALENARIEVLEDVAVLESRLLKIFGSLPTREAVPSLG